MEEPVLEEYLKTLKFFRDEADQDEEEEGEATKVQFKYANEKVNPIRWDKQTVVHEIFRVLQDLTFYDLNLTARSEIRRLGDLDG